MIKLHQFPETLIRAEINPSKMDMKNFEEQIINDIERASQQAAADTIMIDNLTYLCNSSEKGDQAGIFMMKLMNLKMKYNWSLLIIAHTPKRNMTNPITQNYLAGSKKLYNFFDSSTISLCLKLYPWAKFRTTKAGIKMHTLLDLRGNLPVYIHLTDASVHDVKALDTLCIEMGAIYLLDKGYVDFFRLFNHIHKNGAFFVTRAKDNMLYEVVESRGSDPEAGIISDEIMPADRSQAIQELSRKPQNGHL